MDFEFEPPVRIGDQHKTLLPMKRYGELIDFAQSKREEGVASASRWNAIQIELLDALDQGPHERNAAIARFRDLCAELRWLHRAS